MRSRDRIEWQGGSGERAGAQRGNRGPHVPVAQPVDIARKRLHVRKQMVGEQHRLRVLQVRHAGRRRVLVLVRNVYES